MSTFWPAGEESTRFLLNLPRRHHLVNNEHNSPPNPDQRTPLAGGVPNTCTSLFLWSKELLMTWLSRSWPFLECTVISSRLSSGGTRIQCCKWRSILLQSDRYITMDTLAREMSLKTYKNHFLFATGTQRPFFLISKKTGLPDMKTFVLSKSNYSKRLHVSLVRYWCALHFLKTLHQKIW